MAKPTLDKIMNSLPEQSIETLLEIQRIVVSLISQHEQDAEAKIESEKQKLELIRNGGV